MNQSDLISDIAERTGLPKKAVGDVLIVLGEVAKGQMILEEGELPLPGIGKLKANTRGGRSGVNPATGERIDIPPKNGIKLVLAKAMKDALNA